MSRRELKALKRNSERVVQTRLRPCEHRLVMSQQETEAEEYSHSEDRTDECDLRIRLREAETLAEEQQAKIAELEDALGRTQMGMELEKFKALHEQQRHYEKQIVEEKETYRLLDPWPE